MELVKRESKRLRTYDYRSNGAYFITICTDKRKHLFGKVADDEVVLGSLGQIAFDEVANVNSKREYMGIVISKFVVMPNHVHMIINIVGTRLAVSEEQFNHYGKPMSNSISSIVGGYKSGVSRKIHQMELQADTASRVPTVVWQSRYYEHIIRSEKQFNEIWRYIDENPLKWSLDCYYSK